MAFYLINFIINMIFGYAASVTKIKGLSAISVKKIYCYFSVLQLTLIGGLRASTVGWDTHNYIHFYEIIENIDNFKGSMKAMSWMEPGYSILCNIVHFLGGNERITLLIVSLFISATAVYFIYDYCESMVLGVMSLFCFPYFYDSLSLLTNAIVAVLFLLGFISLKKGSFIGYVICGVVAFLFHNIAIVFIPLYFISRINWKNKLTVTLIFLGTIFIYFNLENIIEIISLILKEQHYTMYIGGTSYWFSGNSGGIRTAILYCVLVGLPYISYLANSKNRSMGNFDKNIVETQDFLVGYAILLPVFAILFTISRMFIRLMIIVMPMAGVFVTNEICMIKSFSNKRILTYTYVLLMIAFQVFYLYVDSENIIPYVPYWAG